MTSTLFTDDYLSNLSYVYTDIFVHWLLMDLCSHSEIRSVAQWDKGLISSFGIGTKGGKFSDDLNSVISILIGFPVWTFDKTVFILLSRAANFSVSSSGFQRPRTFCLSGLPGWLMHFRTLGCSRSPFWGSMRYLKIHKSNEDD